MQIDSISKLEKAGLPPSQAHAMMEVMEGELAAHLAPLATTSALSLTEAKLKVEMAEIKGEIAEVRGEMAEVRGEIAEVRVEMANLRTEVKSDFSALKVEFANLKGEMKHAVEAVRSDLMRWTLLCVMSQTTILFGGVYFFLTHFAPR